MQNFSTIRCALLLAAGLLVLPLSAMAALDAIVNHVLPGRSGEIRRPTAKELAATKVIALPLNLASAKIRIGDPNDDPADLESDVWAGTIPLQITAGAPIAAANLANGIPLPPSVTAWT